MDADDLTISSPQSIQKTAIGIAARCKRERCDREKRAEAIKETQARGEEIRAQRQAEAETLDPHLKLALDVWSKALVELECSLPGPFATYIKPLRVLKPNGNFRLAAPNEHVRTWCDVKFRPKIEQEISRAAEREVNNVEFVVDV